MHIEVSVKQITINPSNNCNHAKIVATCRGARKEKCQNKLLELECTELMRHCLLTDCKFIKVGK